MTNETSTNDKNNEKTPEDDFFSLETWGNLPLTSTAAEVVFELRNQVLGTKHIKDVLERYVQKQGNPLEKPIDPEATYLYLLRALASPWYMEVKDSKKDKKKLIKFVRCLMERFGDDYMAEKTQAEHALLQAARLKNYEMMELLLEKGVDPKLTKTRGLLAYYKRRAEMESDPTPCKCSMEDEGVVLASPFFLLKEVNHDMVSYHNLTSKNKDLKKKMDKVHRKLEEALNPEGKILSVKEENDYSKYVIVKDVVDFKAEDSKKRREQSPVHAMYEQFCAEKKHGSLVKDTKSHFPLFSYRFSWEKFNFSLKFWEAVDSLNRNILSKEPVEVLKEYLGTHEGSIAAPFIAEKVRSHLLMVLPILEWRRTDPKRFVKPVFDIVKLFNNRMI